MNDGLRERRYCRTYTAIEAESATVVTSRGDYIYELTAR